MDTVHADCTDFEDICLRDSPPTRVISTLYCLVCSFTQENVLPYLSVRERDRNIRFSTSDRLKVCILPHKLLIASRVQETSYKLLTR